MIWANDYAPAALHPPAVPLTAPVLPLWPAVSVLVGLLPAFVAPLPSGADRAGRADRGERADRADRAAARGRAPAVDPRMKEPTQ